MADHEAALGQRAGEMTLALADPQQRRLRITPNGRLDELAKRFQQSGVPVDRRLKIPTSPLLKYLYLDSFIAFFP